MVLVRGLSWIFKLYQKKTTCLNTNSNTVFPLWDRTKEDAFLAADELWEEIKSLIYSESNGGSCLHAKETGTGGGLQCYILRGRPASRKKGKQWRPTIWRRQKHPEREWLTKEFCPTSFSSPPSFWLRMLKGETIHFIRIFAHVGKYILM